MDGWNVVKENKLGAAAAHQPDAGGPRRLGPDHRMRRSHPPPQRLCLSLARHHPRPPKARARLRTRSPRIPSHHQRGQPRHFFRTLQPQLLLNGAAWLSRKGNSLWSISASIACLCPTYCLTHLAGHRAFCHWIGLKKIGSWLSGTRSCPFYIRNTERRELCLG